MLPEGHNKDMEISEQDFLTKVAGGGRFVVDFFADWCGPCRAFAPIFEKAGKKASIPFVKLDVERCEIAADKYNIKSVPTIILFDGGRAVKSHNGSFGSEAELRAFLCL